MTRRTAPSVFAEVLRIGERTTFSSHEVTKAELVEFADRWDPLSPIRSPELGHHLRGVELQCGADTVFRHPADIEHRTVTIRA